MEWIHWEMCCSLIALGRSEIDLILCFFFFFKFTRNNPSCPDLLSHVYVATPVENTHSHTRFSLRESFKKTGSGIRVYKYYNHLDALTWPVSIKGVL